MRWPLLVLPVVLAAGCAAPPVPDSGEAPPWRLLLAGTVDLSGPAATVAASDAEGVLREVRLAARRADLAVVTAASDDAGDLLGAAGFDLIACPEPRPLSPAADTPAPPIAVTLSCAAGSPGAAFLGADNRAALPGLTVAVAAGPAPALLFGTGTTPASGGLPAVVVGLPLMGRTRLVASGLGALLSSETEGGGLAEILADSHGVIAYRVGRTTRPGFRVRFGGWEPPVGDAVLLDGEWWALARPVAAAAPQRLPEPLPFDRGDLIAAAVGDVTGDGTPDLAASYRHPFRPSSLSEARPGAVAVDSLGRSAHLGVFTLDGEARWAAGMIPRPVGDLAACDGSVALAYTGLDDPQVVAAGAAVWTGWRLSPAPELPGPGVPGCADVDGDGSRDPVILGRSG